MTFKRLSEDKIKIILTQEDLSALSLQYEDLDCRDRQTRDAILSLLESAEAETGFYPEDGHLFVEAYPSDTGCVLYFTAVAGEAPPDRASLCEPAVFSFTDLDTLVTGASALFYTFGHRIFKSALYYGDGAYYLVIYPLDQSQLQSVLLLSEYGELCGKGQLRLAHLQEHCKCLIRDDAIEQITYYLAAKRMD